MTNSMLSHSYTISTPFDKTDRGFSLIEMAIVLFIVALLLGGLLPTVSSQIEQQRTNETRKQMDDIRNALFGYAIINGYLPCPTTTTDPANANYGSTDAVCSAAVEGYLPWKTLGVPETDAWGSKRNSATDPWIGYWRYRVDRNFAGAAFTLNTGFGNCPGTTTLDCLVIQDSAGKTLTNTTERPVAIVYSTGQNVTQNGQNAIYEPASGVYQSDVMSPTFDDMLIWISRPQLINRMVSAGKLP
jgi:prepilin-type N-terminal cleavage/methylation domain-containing protein